MVSDRSYILTGKQQITVVVFQSILSGDGKTVIMPTATMKMELRLVTSAFMRIMRLWAQIAKILMEKTAIGVAGQRPKQ